MSEYTRFPETFEMIRVFVLRSDLSVEFARVVHSRWTGTDMYRQVDFNNSLTKGYEFEVQEGTGARFVADYCDTTYYVFDCLEFLCEKPTRRVTAAYRRSTDDYGPAEEQVFRQVIEGKFEDDRCKY